METSELIRVLIVDSNGETREKIRSLLKSEKDIEVVGVAKSGKEAIELAQTHEPDVVVLDVNLSDMDEIAVTEAICRRVPFSQIVILAVQVDPNYMRRAMLAGARDFIVKPPLPDELRSAVYRAGGLAHERRDSSIRVLPQMTQEITPSKTSTPASQGRIIQVYSPKGGAGTTTLAVNLALALHSPKTKTILVDGNLQYGDVALFLNEVGYHSILDLTPRVDDLDQDVIATVIATHQQSGLDILIAPNRPELADKVSGEEFFKVLQFLRRIYSYVVVDSTTALNDITLSVMDATDIILLVLTQDIAAIKNARLFFSILDGLHVNRQRVIAVINRFDKRIAISPEKVAENIKQEINNVIPAGDLVAIRAANQGQPFILEHRNDPMSRAIQGLAEDLRNQVLTVESAEAVASKVFKTPV